MRRWVIVSSLLLLGVPPPSPAAEGKLASARELLRAGFFQDFEELDLESLLETSDVLLRVAARKEEGVDEAAGVVSILTGEDIRTLGATTLDEALRAIPGVDVVTDSLGRPRVIFRGVASGATGGGSENVLILMNGHRMDDPLFGGATLLNATLPVANIKRIEILRGTGSALFGSGAVAGVIDIITFGPEDFSGIEGSVEAGSFGTQRYGIKLGSRVGSLQTFGYVEFADTNGPRLDLLADSRSSFGDSLAPGRTREDFQTIETNYTATWRNFDAHIRIGNLRSDGFVGLVDALGENDLTYQQVQGDVGYKRRLPNDGTLRLTLSYMQNRYRQVLQPLPPGFTVAEDGSTAVFPNGVSTEQELGSRRYGVEGVFERPAGDHQIVAGLGLGRESAFGLDVKSSYDFRTGEAFDTPKPLDVGDDQGRTLFSAFVQDSWSPSPRVALTAGLRFDQSGDVGGDLSPRAAIVFFLPENVRLKLLYGRAFRAPTFAERDLTLPVIDGGDAVDPLHVDTLEAALSWRRQRFRLSVSTYATFLRDTIEPVGPFSTERSRPAANAPGANLQGIEVELRRTFGVGNSAFLNYAFQHSELSNADAPVPGCPSHLGNLGATFAVGGHVSVTPLVSFRSSRPREAGDPRPDAGGYGIVSATLRAPNLRPGLTLALSGQNLFDKRYSNPSPAGGVPGDYPREGRRILLSATYEF